MLHRRKYLACDSYRLLYGKIIINSKTERIFLHIVYRYRTFKIIQKLFKKFK